jgi:hypothetical protein
MTMPMDHAETLQDRPVRAVRTASALVMLFLAWMFLPEKVCLGQTVPPIVVTSRTMLSDNNPLFDRFAKSQSQGVTYNNLSFGMQGTFGSLAVNQAGDLLQGGYNWDAVWDFPANGGTPYKIYTIPDSNHVSAVATDANGNLVVTSRYGYITTMIPYVNGAYAFYADTLGTTAYAPPGMPTPPLCTGTIANNTVTVTSTSACTYDYPILYWPALSSTGTYLTNGSYLETVAIAFDPQGDSFLADVNDNIGGNNIFECSVECNFGASPPVQLLNFVNPTTTVTPGSCFNKASYFDQIAGLAADAAGNVYFTNDTGTVYEVPAGTAGITTFVPFATGFIAAEGISFDTTGNLYVADNGNTSGKFTDYSCVSTGGGGLWEIPLVNGTLQPSQMFMVFPMGTGSASGTNFQNIWGVAVDQHGNIFAQEGYTDLWKFTVGNAPFPATAVGSGSNPIPLTLTFNAPVTLQSATVTAAGLPSNDFSVVTSGSINATASLTVPIPSSNFQILPSAISLTLPPGLSATETIGIGQASSFTGSVTLAVSGLPTGVTSAFSTDPVTGANLLTLTASSSATPGLASLGVYAPFTATVSGKSVTENESAQILLYIPQPCVFGAVNAAHSSCSINVQFNPTQPGQRNAILMLTDAAGDNVPVYLSGVGVGQAITVDPGTQSAVGSGLKQPGAVAVDGAGNVFVADAGANAVYEYAGGAGAGTPLGSNLSAPGGVAADSAGNLYISDTGNGRVVEIANGAGGPYTGSQSTILTGLNKPGQLAVDGSGTLYIPEAGNNDVVTYVNRSGLASGGVKTIPVTAAAGLDSPSAVALDASNNLYVASPASNTVVESADGAIGNVGANLSAPTGVAVDGSGSVIIANSGSGLILRVPNQNGGLAASSQTIVTSSILNPYAVALDQYGNLVASDSTNGAAYAMNRISGSINFGKVNDESSSAGQTAVVASSGLASLTIDSPFYPALSASTPFTIPNDNCSSLSTLASGFGCTLEAEFDPTNQVGLQSYSVDFSSGAQNAAAPALVLSGNAVNELPSVVTMAQTAPATGNASYGSPVTVTATVAPASGSGATATGTVQFIVDGGNFGQPVTLNGSAQASIVLPSLPGGNHLVAGSYSGDHTYAPSSSSALTVTILSATSSTALSVFGFAASPLTSEPTPPEISGGDFVTMTATIVPSLAGSLSGSVIFSSGSTTLGTATVQSTTSGSVTTYTAALTLSGTNGTMLSAGVYNIVATYEGNSNYSSSFSPATQLIVTQPTFTIAQSSSAISSSAKSPGSSTITVTSESSFTGGVDFSCSGLPAHATCNFVPAVLGLVVGSTAPSNATNLVPTVSTTLTVNVNQAPIITPTGIFWWSGLLLGLSLFGLASNRKARRRLLMQCAAGCVLLPSLAGVSGCGSGTAIFTTPTGSSTITITATATPPTVSGIPNPALNVVQTMTFTLNVQ